MTTETAEAAAAVEASAEAAEAAAEAAEAVAEAAEAEAVEEAVAEEAAPAPPVAVNPEGAHDDAVQLDHEQRITRAEDAIAGIAAAVADRPTFEEVRSMTPNYGEVAEVAAAVAEEAAEEAAEEVAEEVAEELRDEGEGEAEATDIAAAEPEVPPANEGDTPERRRGFRW